MMRTEEALSVLADLFIGTRRERTWHLACGGNDKDMPCPS